MGGGGMGDGGLFGFTTDPDALLELDGKDALNALQDLTPVVTKTMQVYSDMMYNLIRNADKRNDSLSVEHDVQQQEVMNLDTKIMTFQAEMDTNWKEQESTNNEWDKRMRKVEAVIAGLPAWKEETINMIRENKRSDDTRYAEMLGRLQDLENDYAVVKDDVASRLAEVEEGKEKATLSMQAADRRIVALEEDMKRRVTELAKLSEETTNKFAETEEQIGAIKLSFSRFNHEFKLLEASHEDLRKQLEKDVYKLSEQLQLAQQERAQLGHDISITKSSMEDGDARLHDRLDGLQPALHDLENLKTELGGMRMELEATMNDMDDIAPPPPTQDPSSSSAGTSREGSSREGTPSSAKGAKLKMLAKMAVKTAGTKSRDGSPTGQAKGGVAGGLTYMMNYLKERIEGMSEHTIEQDQEIGDLQTRTGEIVLDLMRLRKTEDDMVTVKTTIREHKDLIDRNKTELANNVARQAEEDQQIYALIEKKASETAKNVKMDVKAAKAELKSLHESNVGLIQQVSDKIGALSGQVQENEKKGSELAGVNIDASTVKMMQESAAAVAEMQGKIVLAEEHIEAHEQRLTDQGAQIYDLSAKVLTELEKELNGIRDDIQDKTSMLHREVLLRPTEPDVKEIFTALKMGMMGETASYELKQMMERLLQASKNHLLGFSAPSPHKSLSGSGGQSVPGTPDNARVPHLGKLEKSPPQEVDSSSSLIQSLQERLDQLVDRPHSCVDSLVLYTYLLTARMDTLTQHSGQMLKKIANVQKEASQSFEEVAKIAQQIPAEKSGGADSKQIKRLENAIRELAKITLSQDRDTVMLGSVSKDMKGEFYKCLSCDNSPIPVGDLQREPPTILPSLGATTPQAHLGRDSKMLNPDRMRAKTASPERASSRGRMFASNPISHSHELDAQLEGPNSQRAAIHTNMPTVLSTSQQMSEGLSIRMESFAPYADMPPPQFHGRGREMRRELVAQGNGVSNSLELPSIASAPNIHSPRPQDAGGK